MAAPPKNFQEWLKTAPIEAIVEGLYERVQASNLEIEKLKSELADLKAGMVTHKHAENTGEATIPMGAVINIAK